MVGSNFLLVIHILQGMEVSKSTDVFSSNSKVSDKFEALHFWLNFVDSLSKIFMHETASSTQ